MRILVIEDQTDLAQFLYEALTDACFVVDIAGDGVRGVYLATLNDYDIIILDSNLPRKKGPDVCREIRQAGKTTPILVLSVEKDTVKKIELLDRGADDYMTKPFSFGELMARIRAMLRRQPTVTAEKLVIDDLTINTATHDVNRGEKPINLTRKEFMLLEYLIKNKDAVITRGKIIEHVWDMNADIFSNTIETHILTLRKKIEFPGKSKLLHTIAGRGYQLTLKK